MLFISLAGDQYRFHKTNELGSLDLPNYVLRVEESFIFTPKFQVRILYLHVRFLFCVNLLF